MNHIQKPFYFKNFSIAQDRCLMKVGTDSVLLGAWADIIGAKKVLDIGTGTGILALMVAQRNSEVKIHAVEIDENSAQQSKENCAQSIWSDRITVYHKSIQEFCKIRLDQYDHIITNPPFFVNSTLSTDKTRNTARHALELTHTDILKASNILLIKNGFLSLILPLHEAREFIGEAISFGFYCNKIVEIYPKENKPAARLLMKFSREPMPAEIDKLVIQKSDEGNDYTEPYKELTKDFYKLL
jgi:tRNA1Val (adenine37-N6)-methyltransferase